MNEDCKALADKTGGISPNLALLEAGQTQRNVLRECWTQVSLFQLTNFNWLLRKATLWVKAQHEGALPPPCIVRKDPRVPHTARRGA